VVPTTACWILSSESSELSVMASVVLDTTAIPPEIIGPPNFPRKLSAPSSTILGYKRKAGQNGKMM